MANEVVVVTRRKAIDKIGIIRPNAGWGRYPVSDLSVPWRGFFIENQTGADVYIAFDVENSTVDNSIYLADGENISDDDVVVERFVSAYCASDTSDTNGVRVVGFKEQFVDDQIRKVSAKAGRVGASQIYREDKYPEYLRAGKVEKRRSRNLFED